jgi:hypothetical protein
MQNENFLNNKRFFKRNIVLNKLIQKSACAVYSKESLVIGLYVTALLT